MPKCMDQDAKTLINPIVYLCLTLPEWLQAPILKVHKNVLYLVSKLIIIYNQSAFDFCISLQYIVFITITSQYHAGNTKKKKNIH